MYRNNLYEMRMKEFRMNYMNQPNGESDNHSSLPNINVLRPKCSSPFETTSESFNENYSESSSNYSSNVSNSCDKSNYLMPFSNNFDSGFHQNSSLMTSSPYLVPIHNRIQNRLLNDVKQSIQFQSTPNKSFVKQDLATELPRKKDKVNFHSIHDLATSSSSEVDESKLSNNSGLNSSENIQQNDYSSFNEKLRVMSQMITNNKENNNDLISKTKRKPRTQINKQQKEILEYAYKMKSYPDSNEIEYLCNLLGFEENVIRIWFQNKRARNKTRN